MIGPTGQTGKNNTRELFSLSVRLEEPEGRLLPHAVLGASVRCFGSAEAGLAALRLVQGIPPGVLRPPFPSLLSTPGQQLLRLGTHAQAAAGCWGGCGGKGWPLLPPPVHTFLPLEKSLPSILIPKICS